MKLADFYKNTVATNEAQTGGWSALYYGVLTKVVRENNFKSLVEVGIGYGTHAKYLLQTTDVERLVLVDPMKYYPNDGFAEDIMNTIPSQPGKHFDEMHDLIRQELSPWEGRYVWHRIESLRITNEQVPDESVDCVFVDGDHSYLACLNDLNFWWNKVRPGGQLLGDDYWMEEVSNAVETFAEIKGISYDFLYKEGTTYKIFRFHKPVRAV
jgi:hypothetical protein